MTAKKAAKSAVTTATPDTDVPEKKVSKVARVAKPVDAATAESAAAEPKKRGRKPKAAAGADAPAAKKTAKKATSFDEDDVGDIETELEVELDATEAEAAAEVPATEDKPKAKPLRMKVSRAKERALMREFGIDETALSEEEVAKRRQELKTLIKMGKTRGFLTHQEINDHLPEKLVNEEILEAIISMLNDMGIAVYEQAPDAAVAIELHADGRCLLSLAFAEDFAIVDTARGTLPWLARKHGDTVINITTRATRLPTGVYPARNTDHALEVIGKVFPSVERCEDALSGALMNAGPIIHPPLIMMNAGPLEHFPAWDIHNEGTQPSVRAVTTQLDNERMRIREALGYGAPHFPLSDHYENDQWMYGDRSSHAKLVKSGDWREKIDLHEHRYMREDTMLGLAFFASVADWAGVDAPVTKGLLAIAGAIIAIRMTGNSINVYSQIGMIMLVGLMAKNGILIVEFANQLRDQGRSVNQAIIEGATVRFRPVLMTGISTIFGALPLVMAVGAGAESRISIGVVIIGGLLFATVLTLFIIPLLYNWLAGYASSANAIAERLDRELPEGESH